MDTEEQGTADQPSLPEPAPSPPEAPPAHFIPPAEWPEALRFLGTIFGSLHYVLFRPMETWTEAGRKQSRVIFKHVLHPPAFPTLLFQALERLARVAETERANVFFGACPRYGDKSQFDLAWQIRTVLCLWADLDHCSVDEALQRCRDAGLPEPSMVVNSGNGVHLYWLLDTPYLITDVGPPPPIYTTWIAGQKGPRRYFVDELGDEIEVQERNLHPKLSPQAVFFQDVLSGLADKIEGDHTTDLSRLLRVPGFLNRKEERNGQAPTPCTLVHWNPERRYSFETFRHLAEKAPAAATRQKIASMPLPKVRKPTLRRQDTLERLIAASTVAPEGERSVVDFSLCCFAIRNCIDKQLVQQSVAQIGKFAEGGDRYFEGTWANAENAVRVEMFEKFSHTSVSGDSIDPPGGNGDERDEIYVTTDEAQVVEDVVEVLPLVENLYQRGGLLVELVKEAELPECLLRDESGPRIINLAMPRLRESLTKVARFIRPCGEGETEPCHPPEWLIKQVDARKRWPGVHHLEAIVQSPVMLSDGSILQQHGYDARSGLFFWPDGEFPLVPDAPTIADALTACEQLLELVADFPFQKPAHRAAWLASALTPLARHAFDGPVPLFSIDANIRGSGKSMLADSVGRIAHGRNLARTSAPADDEEARKKITSIALVAEQIVLMDNVIGTLGCASLDAALTGTTWSDRILGKSQMTGDLPLTTIWFATGNNLIFAADTSRRALHIRLQSDLERPEDRQGFRHENLLEWVSEHRHRLAVAGLTILRAYHVAGRPRQDIKPWGSFEAWSRLVRHAIVWCGLSDPGSTRQELAMESDRDARLLRLLMDAWQEVDPGGTGVSVVQAIDAAAADGAHPTMRAAIAELTVAGKPPSAKSIGMKLHHLQGRVCGGRAFSRIDTRNGAVWRVCDLQEVSHA
jgi:hypothetical protein